MTTVPMLFWRISMPEMANGASAKTILYRLRAAVRSPANSGNSSCSRIRCITCGQTVRAQDVLEYLYAAGGTLGTLADELVLEYPELSEANP